MNVCSAISGEPLVFVSTDDLQGQSAKAVKQLLAIQLGISRFRQRFLVEDASRIIPDDEVFAALLPVTVHLVSLKFEKTERGTAVQEMIAASRDNQSDALENLLRRPINPNLRDELDWTPLHHAADNGHLEPVKLLIEAESDTGASDNEGWTPLLLASSQGHLEVVRFLIAAGADFNKTTTNEGISPLYIASHQGHVEVVPLLVEAGADVNQATTDHGVSPLSTASKKGHVEVVRLLIEAGADFNQAGTNCASPLCIASLRGHVEVVRLLVEAGANKNQATRIITYRKRHVEVARLLVEAGANKNQATTDDGASPLRIVPRKRQRRS